ncbi:phosphatidate cytidylyltransferase [Psychromonas aquimarina]|uniref:phosphatidate cytidylyltransferase n=1 Tax=Psychromonas aquimarina TaxID=444919 RepID=UPI0004183341|nr:phosphatidate cytidylyltransferase [Psychromonas aquimarina]
MFQMLTIEIGYVMAGIVVTLLAGSVAIVSLRPKFSVETGVKHLASMRSWWILVFLFFLAISFSKFIYIALFCALALLAFSEFCHFSRARLNNYPIICCFILICAHYFVISQYSYYYFWGIAAATPCVIVLVVKYTLGYSKVLRFSFKLTVGVLICGFMLGHAAVVINLLPADNYSSAGAALYLVLLTELNDAFQYVWGKALGKHKVVRVLSPNKTLEGYVGGVISTVAVGVAIYPMLVPLSLYQSFVASLIIAVGGCGGDLFMSSLKRYFNVKDTSSILPGHGGILDRLDSLCVSSPLFFYYYLSL